MGKKKSGKKKNGKKESPTKQQVAPIEQKQHETPVEKMEQVTPVKKKTFDIGDLVVLKGLQKADLNGLTGYVVRGEHDGRLAVLLSGKPVPVSIRPVNIELGPLRVGDRVLVKGMNGSALNGKVGRVVVASSQAYTISLEERHAMFYPVFRENLLPQNKKVMLKVKQLEKKLEKQLEKQLEKRHEGNSLADYRLEMEEAGFPIGVDQEWATRMVDDDYKFAVTLPNKTEELKLPSYELDPFALVRRVGTKDPRVLGWYASAQPNSIFPSRVQSDFIEKCRRSFSDQTYRMPPIFAGTCHAAVGFEDLGMLVPTEIMKYRRPRSGPCQYFGIDSCPYAVAKALVIAEMFRLTPMILGRPIEANVYAITQVWFSATWSEGTSELVDEALASLLAKEESSTHSQVRRLLVHWYEAPTTSLEDARQYVIDSTTSLHAMGANLIHKMDRVAFLSYLLTRDFALRGSPVCGNKIMWDCPMGTPPLANDENVFSALDLEFIVREHSGPRVSIVDMAIKYAIAKVRKIAKWIQREELTIELVCARIEDVAEEVRSRSPATMSWSNLCDDMEYADFHRVARRCAVEETMHSSYTMRWTQRTRGVSLFDFTLPERADFRADMISRASRNVGMMYESRRWEEFMCIPPLRDPMIWTAQFVMEHSEAWSTFFFQIARVRGEVDAADVDHAVSSPLSMSGGSTLFLCWSFC